MSTHPAAAGFRLGDDIHLVAAEDEGGVDVDFVFTGAGGVSACGIAFYCIVFEPEHFGLPAGVAAVGVFGVDVGAGFRPDSCGCAVGSLWGSDRSRRCARPAC